MEEIYHLVDKYFSLENVRNTLLLFSDELSKSLNENILEYNINYNLIPLSPRYNVIKSYVDNLKMVASEDAFGDILENIRTEIKSQITLGTNPVDVIIICLIAMLTILVVLYTNYMRLLVPSGYRRLTNNYSYINDYFEANLNI